MQISLNLNISPYNLINPLISISFFFFSPKNFLKHTQYECFYFPMDLIQIWIYIKIPNIYFSSVLNKNNSHVKIIINISFYARLKIETENEMDQVRKKKRSLIPRNLFDPNLLYRTDRTNIVTRNTRFARSVVDVVLLTRWLRSKSAKHICNLSHSRVPMRMGITECARNKIRGDS